TYFPLYRATTHYANPALERFNASNRISLSATDCQVHIFALPTTRYSDCDKVRNILTSRSVNYDHLEASPGAAPVLRINDTEIPPHRVPSTKQHGARTAAGLRGKDHRRARGRGLPGQVRFLGVQLERGERG